MKVNERIVNCACNENIEKKNFTDELVDFPHIIEYIQELQEQLKLQQEDITELKNKLTNYENQITPEKSFKDNETQSNWLELEENSLVQEWVINNDKQMSIADQVTQSAELAMLQTGFVYEQTTGLYYHYNSGYYYDSKSGLYYNGNTGTYYYYDKENKSYKFHSQIQNDSDVLCYIKDTINENKKEEAKMKKVKLMQEGNQSNADKSKEGECSDNEDIETLSSKEDTRSSSGSNSDTENDEGLSKVYPPCMRIIVKETNLSNLKVGSLFIVTCTGGTLGREGDHSVLISDINISKYHAKVQYNTKKKVYEIIDLGSRNGTFLNGKRLSAAKQESNETEIVHGSILQVGCTKLLCHIHTGHKTCGHCEPGLLLSDAVTDESISTKTQHRLELKRLKSKFGIDHNNESTCRLALGYQDRAQLRREELGSISNEEILQVDCTKLLCHIHTGHKTCGHCEPGLLLSDAVTDESVPMKTQHRLELKRLKSKFGIEQYNNESAYRLALGYQDRAQLRREQLGSTSDHFKTQQSSLDKHISKDNMGFKMLLKMGWTEGHSLGKSGNGVIEPITLAPVFNKAGFGSKGQTCTAQKDSNIEKKENMQQTEQCINEMKN
ncbi:PREDICTED: angiogenic factor with G patch and FHA domains 1-like [Ceratosolen solmsi marchali]|uniref:Angiogenic factor with G patch and FHA domains 1-like n=1 Tax=Ceratosolen solmsi marchali TaxID=326594 RepID=A0AAJ6YTW8_9HYME|nr:PREDICTED: angiogenic factor with G patch and FHA domains 1-like [Ceratosolen solmsi marchali]